MSIWTSPSRFRFRRARGDIDGPHSTYALALADAGRRIPLAASQLAELRKQIEWLEDQSSRVIEGTVEQLLLSDQKGSEPMLDLTGFLRVERPYDSNESKADGDGLSDTCDCGRSLESGFLFDVCSNLNLVWSWMCPICFFRMGCGLGTGFGQLYRRHGSEVSLVWGGDPDV